MDEVEFRHSWLALALQTTCAKQIISTLTQERTHAFIMDGGAGWKLVSSRQLSLYSHFNVTNGVNYCRNLAMRSGAVGIGIPGGLTNQPCAVFLPNGAVVTIPIPAYNATIISEGLLNSYYEEWISFFGSLSTFVITSNYDNRATFAMKCISYWNNIYDLIYQYCDINLPFQYIYEELVGDDYLSLPAVTVVDHCSKRIEIGSR